MHDTNGQKPTVKYDSTQTPPWRYRFPEALKNSVGRQLRFNTDCDVSELSGFVVDGIPASAVEIDPEWVLIQMKKMICRACRRAIGSPCQRYMIGNVGANLPNPYNTFELELGDLLQFLILGESPDHSGGGFSQKNRISASGGIGDPAAGEPSF